MSIVMFLTEEQWETDGRFQNIPDHVDGVVVTSCSDDDHDEPPSALVSFRHYERYNDQRGTGWEIFDQGEDDRNSFPHLKPQRIKTNDGWAWETPQ
jgi:hypothetical protein